MNLTKSQRSFLQKLAEGYTCYAYHSFTARPKDGGAYLYRISGSEMKRPLSENMLNSLFSAKLIYSQYKDQKDVSKRFYNTLTEGSRIFISQEGMEALKNKAPRPRKKVAVAHIAVFEFTCPDCDEFIPSSDGSHLFPVNEIPDTLTCSGCKTELRVPETLKGNRK